MQHRATAALKIETVSNDLADQSYEAVRRIRLLARQRGEDQIADLEEVVSISFMLISLLLRSATVLNSSVPSHKAIQNDFRRLEEITARSRYLTDQERAAINFAVKIMGDFFAELQVSNPKAKIVGDLLSHDRTLTLICPDARLQPDLVATFSMSGARIVTAYSDEGGDLRGAIIPGWFRKDRMAALVVPPITKPIHLVLYGIERKWLEDCRMGLLPQTSYLGPVIHTRPYSPQLGGHDSGQIFQSSLLVPGGLGASIWDIEEFAELSSIPDGLESAAFMRHVPFEQCERAIRALLSPHIPLLTNRFLRALDWLQP